MGVGERTTGVLPPLMLRADLASRLIGPSRSYASRGSCRERQKIEVATGLANSARILFPSLFPLPLLLVPERLWGFWSEDIARSTSPGAQQLGAARKASSRDSALSRSGRSGG